ncbi:hypothetical protein [Hymenobacter algoricola]|uniref:Uncharacterized protein n=1 Tax=Hymenobacter algoricola TaxID=486267 RepID=A0ABP7N948_9BACT
MTEDELLPESTLKLLDDGTMFSGRHFWVNGEAAELTCAIGVWAWEDVSYVGTVPKGMMEDMPAPRCYLRWRGEYVYLQAYFEETQRAYRNFRKGNQVRKAFPFSGIFPFSGN